MEGPLLADVAMWLPFIDAPCKFHSKPSGCRYGDRCRFSHDIPDHRRGWLCYPANKKEFQDRAARSKEKVVMGVQVVAGEVMKDMVVWETHNIWPFSVYGLPGGKSLGGFKDKSIEEIRYELTEPKTKDRFMNALVNRHDGVIRRRRFLAGSFLETETTIMTALGLRSAPFHDNGLDRINFDDINSFSRSEKYEALNNVLFGTKRTPDFTHVELKQPFPSGPIELKTKAQLAREAQNRDSSSSACFRGGFEIPKRVAMFGVGQSHHESYPEYGSTIDRHSDGYAAQTLLHHSQLLHSQQVPAGVGRGRGVWYVSAKFDTENIPSETQEYGAHVNNLMNATREFTNLLNNVKVKDEIVETACGGRYPSPSFDPEKTSSETTERGAQVNCLMTANVECPAWKKTYCDVASGASSTAKKPVVDSNYYTEEQLSFMSPTKRKEYLDLEKRLVDLRAANLIIKQSLQEFMDSLENATLQSTDDRQLQSIMGPFSQPISLSQPTSLPQETSMPEATSLAQSASQPQAASLPQANLLPQAILSPQSNLLPRTTSLAQSTSLPEPTCVLGLLTRTFLKYEASINI